MSRAVLTWEHDGVRDRAVLAVDGTEVDARFVDAAEEEGPYTEVEDVMFAAAGVDRADVEIVCEL